MTICVNPTELHEVLSKLGKLKKLDLWSVPHSRRLSFEDSVSGAVGSECKALGSLSKRVSVDFRQFSQLIKSLSSAEFITIIYGEPWLIVEHETGRITIAAKEVARPPQPSLDKPRKTVKPSPTQQKLDLWDFSLNMPFEEK